MINCKNQITLENERSSLRPLQPEDLELLLHISQSHPTLLKYSPSKFGTQAALKSYIDKAVDGRTRGHRYPFIIFDKATQSYAGTTSFGNISNANQRIEIGWTWMGEQYQRTGLNRNNKFLMLQYAFENCGYERVEFKTDVRNQKSRTAIEKIGGTAEGILRSHTLMSDGYRRDTIYYSILKREWPEIKSTTFKGFHS